MLRNFWAIEKSKTTLLDLSTNVCFDSLLKIPNTYVVDRYPTEHINYLHLSQYLSVPVENLSIGYGLGELVPRIFNCFRNKSFTIVQPNWQLLEIICQVNDIKYNNFNYVDFNHLDIDTLCDAKSDILYITNPNGVNGSIIKKDDILRLSQKYEILIVDEAYMDFGDQSVMNDIIDNVIVCKSFSKTIASPGIRFGYCVSAKQLIEKIQDNRPGYVMINYDIKGIIDNIPDHLSRMLETKSYITQNFNTTCSYGNFVLFNGKPKLNCITKEVYPDIHRMSLTDIETFKNIII